MQTARQYIGKQLIVLRKSTTNMSQKELAKRTGLSQSTVSRMESDLQAADVGQRVKLATQLNVTPDELVGLPAPSFHIENQHGGYGVNYLINNIDDAVKFKDEVIASKEATIKALEGTIRAQSDLIASLQLELSKRQQNK